jgi:diaminopimelate epimerase
MCGNGIRCVAKYAIDAGLAPYPALNIETGRGVLALEAWRGDSGKVERVTVGMGVPDFSRPAVPVTIPGDGPLLDHPVSLGGREFRISAVSMGNPHCIVLVDDCEGVPVDQWGPLLENAPFFPKRANIEFVSLGAPGEARIRTWERGSGETLACGTGASAVCAVLTRLGLVDGHLKARLRGGELELSLTDGSIFLTGPAVEVFRGVYAPA